MATTFVTCIFDYNEALLNKWIDVQLPLIVYVTENHFQNVSSVLQQKGSSRIHLQKMPSIQQTEWYSSDSLIMPSVRNVVKDTPEHLWNVHSKVFAVYNAVMHHNVFQSNYYMYLDFHCPELFHQDSTWEYLRENFTNRHLFTAKHDNTIFLPGCWGETKEINESFFNNVNWRFCGSLMFGSTNAFIVFYQHYIQFFQEFVKTYHILSWEVNFWAWLEHKIPSWKPYWYSAGHDDNMVHIPGVFSYNILTQIDASQTLYNYPSITPYFPMSASYVHYKDKHVLNTRFVNYWIYPNGGYYYPEDEGVIRTLNVCSIYGNTEFKTSPNNYQVMKEDTSFTKNTNVFSEGIEDMRLYVSQDGSLRFIGSTLSYSHTDSIRTIIGDYNIQSHCCENFININSPYNNWCEKNWAPIPMSDGSDGFIYKWRPMEIGTLVKNDTTDTYDLKITVRKQLDYRFHDMKGSTSFTPYGSNGLIGVVHFSQETSPRQYYHRVVVLHKDTFDVLQCSDIFCFRRPCVEFCIGFCVLDSCFGFWISQMDRDPLYIEIPINKVLSA